MTPIEVAYAQRTFQLPLIVEYVDGDTWVVKAPFSYVSPRITIHVPAGFQTDFASVPRFFWRILPRTDKRIGKPSIIHDYIYKEPSIKFTRKQADEEFREAMACVGANAFDRNIAYAAVRVGGARAWVER
jgi:hypothetical protein